MKPIVETLEPGPDESFLSYDVQWRSMEDYIGWHLHPEYEITYWEKARGALYVGDNVLDVSSGDLFLIGPNLPICYSEDEHLEDKFRSMTVVFDPEMAFGSILERPELQGVDTLLKASTRGLKFPAVNDPQCIESLNHAVNGEGITRYTGLLHTLARLSVNPVNAPLVSEGFYTDEAEFDARRMSEIVGYVKRNLANDIVQGALADALGMTPSSFSRFFRNATGRTFISFVNLIRISEACKLLNYTDDDITNIAFSCGYSNLSNFNRHFKELRGMTPTEYRELHRKL